MQVFAFTNSLLSRIGRGRAREQPMTYCASIAQARNGETILLGKDKHVCKLDAANLGLIAVPETIASGKAHTGIIFKCALT